MRRPGPHLLVGAHSITVKPAARYGGQGIQGPFKKLLNQMKLTMANLILIRILDAQQLHVTRACHCLPL